MRKKLFRGLLSQGWTPILKPTTRSTPSVSFGIILKLMVPIAFFLSSIFCLFLHVLCLSTLATYLVSSLATFSRKDQVIWFNIRIQRSSRVSWWVQLEQDEWSTITPKAHSKDCCGNNRTLPSMKYPYECSQLHKKLHDEKNELCLSTLSST